MKVIKSSGIAQDFDPQKILNVAAWACENTSIDPYVFFDEVKPQIQDNMSTAQIQDLLIKFSANMITELEPDYQFVAANLQQFALRKKVYGRFTPVDLYTHINNCISKGVYDSEIVEKYSKEEIDFLNEKIDHNRDFTYSYAGSSQLIEKYLVQDRSTGTLFETPQMALMLIGMCLHQEEKQNRLEHVVEFYNAASLQQISLPTPIMAGVRTPTRQFSSCVVIDADDSLDGINAASAAIVKYVSRRAGIGLNAGMIRAEGSKVRSGEVKHTGVIPFWKHFQTAVGSSSQGGVRKGSATVNWPIWHLEFENLVVLKNNKGTEESRIRHMDYCVQINNLMMERLLNNDYITLFSPNVLDGDLYNAYFTNEELFRNLYERLENDPNVRKKRIKAIDAFQQIINERTNTARIYLSFVDNVNRYGPFDRRIDPIRMSNLCLSGDSVVEVKVLGKEQKITLKDLNEIFEKDTIQIKSFDGDKVVWSDVVDSALMNNSAEVLEIETPNGNKIVCTEYHKIYTKRGWIMAKDLLETDELLEI